MLKVVFFPRVLNLVHLLLALHSFDLLGISVIIQSPSSFFFYLTVVHDRQIWHAHLSICLASKLFHFITFYFNYCNIIVNLFRLFVM